jgi:hypothetical protein
MLTHLALYKKRMTKFGIHFNTYAQQTVLTYSKSHETNPNILFQNYKLVKNRVS